MKISSMISALCCAALLACTVLSCFFYSFAPTDFSARETGGMQAEDLLRQSVSERTAYASERGKETERVAVQKEYTEYFSTLISISLYVEPSRVSEAEEACAAAEEVIADIENAVSVTAEGSDIYRFNNELAAGERMEISARTHAIVSLAAEMYRRTDGAYDPSVAPLVDLWGFSPRFYREDYAAVEAYDRADFKNDLPEREYVEAFRSLAVFDEVELSEEDGRYYITKPDKTVAVAGTEYGVRLDFGGIAKGYACDLAADIFRSYGFLYGNISVGNSSIYLLRSPADAEGLFDVGVRNPRAEESGWDGDILANLRTKEGGVSTSGDYERYYVTHNRRYCHIISAETGEPIDTGINMACIVGGSAAENDALTTALCVMGKERAMHFLEELTDKTAFFVWENGQTGKYEVIANCEKDQIELNASARGFVLCGYKKDGVFVYEASAASDWVQIAVGIVIAVAVVGVIVGLGIRNHVLKRNQTSTKE